MKDHQKGENRMMYGHLNARMAFPSTHKDLMENALSHERKRHRRLRMPLKNYKMEAK